MNYELELTKHLRKLMYKDDSVLYRTNIQYLKTYYLYLINLMNSKPNDDMVLSFISKFDTISSINMSNVENSFTSLIMDNTDLFEVKTTKIEDDPGIYFLYDQYDELMYIGKSYDLSKRIITSSISKIPFGISSYHYDIFKDVPKNGVLELFEAVLIDFHDPLLNNKVEDYGDISHKTYAKMVRTFEKLFYDKRKSIELIYKPSIIEE